ncbi:carbohydrate porin, partial [Planctomycetota bacterium]
MNRLRILTIVATLLFFGGICRAEQKENHIWNRETLTDGFFGLNKILADSGIEVGFGVTSIYQQNVRGGISKHRRAGRITGSYDMEISADFQKLLGFESGTLFLHLEGGWPDAEGIDGVSVGSAFGVNADAIGNDAILVKQLYYEGLILNDNLTLMIGKIDFTGVFDASDYADCECTQFLNGAFVDNPTIPFPQYSLGLVLTYAMTDTWYVMAGMADVQADSRETGFRTTFGDEDYFFYALETGVTSRLNSANGPMSGRYRAG